MGSANFSTKGRVSSILSFVGFKQLLDSAWEAQTAVDNKEVNEHGAWQC